MAIPVVSALRVQSHSERSVGNKISKHCRLCVEDKLESAVGEAKRWDYYDFAYIRSVGAPGRDPQCLPRETQTTTTRSRREPPHCAQRETSYTIALQ